MSPEQYTAEALAQATEDSLRELSVPMTSTERARALRKRRKGAGLREVRGAWGHPDDHAEIRAFAASLAKSRAESQARPSWFAATPGTNIKSP